MDKEKDECCKPIKKYHGGGTASGGAVYGMGFIGAIIYFIQHADTFWIGVLGILKAIVWPVIIIYKALEAFKL